RPGWLRPNGLVLGLALLVSACAATTAPRLADARAVPDSFAPLVKKVLPAVVNIAITETVNSGDVAAQLPPELRDTPLGREFRRRFGAQREQVMGAGSGFIIDPSGIIVTNNHVVGHASRIVVSLSDGTELPARVIGSDELTDVAVIKVETPHPLAAVAWGDSSKVEVGDWILTAGNPFGLGGSITAGIVSAEGRDLGEGPFDRFLQLDAPINPGNSGGPAFNLDGQVVGMTTAIVSPSGGSVGIGFAIPSNLIRHTVEELRTRGRIERGWLGVSVQGLGRSNSRHSTVEIAGVAPSGPALHAGLRAGDVVLAVDGQNIDSTGGLIRAVAERAPGSTVRVTVRRGGHELTVPVIIGRRPPDQSG
ncbi:MAG TPA: trypsin-like peptidase domain-containing protein, partial [Acetobacteraceae bacterium]|nr:trypsin-like peptidase domain-containing protein [Acetobacteraceae bacterium]